MGATPTEAPATPTEAPATPTEAPDARAETTTAAAGETTTAAAGDTTTAAGEETTTACDCAAFDCDGDSGAGSASMSLLALLRPAVRSAAVRSARGPLGLRSARPAVRSGRLPP